MQMFPRCVISDGGNIEYAIDCQALSMFVYIGQAIQSTTSPEHYSEVHLCYKKYNY
jgi:hypothetical protein